MSAVVDDHPLVREGIVNAIAPADDFMAVGEGATVAESLEFVPETRPAFLLLDLGIPGLGLAALGEINRIHVPTSVIVLTVPGDSGDVLEALRHGASAYALKGISGPGPTVVVRRVHRSER